MCVEKRCVINLNNYKNTLNTSILYEPDKFTINTPMYSVMRTLHTTYPMWSICHLRNPPKKVLGNQLKSRGYHLWHARKPACKIEISSKPHEKESTKPENMTFHEILIGLYEQRTKPITSAKGRGWNGHRVLCVPHHSWGFNVCNKIRRTCVSRVIVFCVTPIVPESFMMVPSINVLV